MKTTIKITKYLTLLSIFLIFSCSSDDDSPGTTPLSVQNFIETVDENQLDGASIGTIVATGQGTLNFSITSQTPAGALDINSSTGALTVADASAFDFETNTVINATVSVIDALNTATSTVAININDIDAIESLLSTSQADFSAAENGDWVMITEAEYIDLTTSLNMVTKVGTSDADYDSSETTFSSSSNFTAANNNGETIPSNSYVFAFKYNSINDGITANKVKQSSTSISDDYVDLGGTLPSSIVGENYVVLKGSNASTTNTGFLAIYQSNYMGVKTIAGNTYNYYNTSPNNDANSLPNSSSSGGTFLYQGLSTTQMQW